MYRIVGFTSARVASAALAFAALTALSGCKQDLSGMGNSPSLPSGSNPAAGIWSGMDSATGQQMTGLIDASGNADFILANGVQYAGTVQTAGSQIAISLIGYPQFGAQFSDGTVYGVGTFQGALTSGTSITGNLIFRTSNSTGESSQWTLSFSPLYNTASSLAGVSGTYSDAGTAVSQGLDPLAGATVAISATGAVTSRNATSGCALTGTLSSPDTTGNLLDITYTYQNCTGSYAVLNGLQFTGLVENNVNASPVQLVIGSSAPSSAGIYYGVVFALSRM